MEPFHFLSIAHNHSIFSTTIITANVCSPSPLGMNTRHITGNMIWTTGKCFSETCFFFHKHWCWEKIFSKLSNSWHCPKNWFKSLSLDVELLFDRLEDLAVAYARYFCKNPNQWPQTIISVKFIGFGVVKSKFHITLIPNYPRICFSSKWNKNLDWKFLWIS